MIEETEEKTTKGKQDNKKQEKAPSLNKQLAGKEIFLTPSAAFFMEDNGHFVLTNYPNRETENGRKIQFNDSSVIIQEGWEMDAIIRNIKAGILRVKDKSGEDISSKFGGPARAHGRNMKIPIVTGTAKKLDENDQRDKKLKGILNGNNEGAILRKIAETRPPFEVLERLYQLEIQGENPSFTSRQLVLDGLKELMENTTGIGVIGKIEDEGKTKVSHK